MGVSSHRGRRIENGGQGQYLTAPDFSPEALPAFSVSYTFYQDN